MYKYIKYEINDDKEKSEKVVKVTIDSSEVQKSVANAAKKFQIRAKLKGFRPGHAPMDVVMSTFQPEILSESSNDLFNDILSQVIKNEKLTPIAVTQVANENSENEKEAILVFRIPIYPEVQTPDLDKIKVEYKEAEINDEEIEEGVKRIWNNYKKEGESEEPTFTEEHFKEMNIPTVKDMDTLKEWIKTSILQFKESQLMSEFGKKFLDQAISDANIIIHDQIIETEKQRRLNELQKVVQRNKTTLEEALKAENMTEEEYLKRLTDEIKQSVSMEIILRDLAKKWEIVVDEDEINHEMKHASNFASNHANNPEYIKEVIKDSILRDKAYHQILDKYYPKKGTAE